MTRNHDGDTADFRGGFLRGDDGRIYHVDPDGTRTCVQGVHPYEGDPRDARLPLVRTGQGTSQVDYHEPAAAEAVTGVAAWVSYAVTLAAGVAVGGFFVWRWMGGAM